MNDHAPKAEPRIATLKQITGSRGQRAGPSERTRRNKGDKDKDTGKGKVQGKQIQPSLEHPEWEKILHDLTDSS